MKSFKEQEMKMLQRCKFAILTSINKSGYLRSIPISKNRTENFSKIGMVTRTNTFKTEHFPKGTRKDSYILLKLEGNYGTNCIDREFNYRKI